MGANEKWVKLSHCDVVVAGGGTAGVVAALASARNGAKTTLVELKGYTGGIAVEGGTALHSFYNLWKAFPGVEKRQVVKGIPQEIIDRLQEVGGTSGHAEMQQGYDYDSVCGMMITSDWEAHMSTRNTVACMGQGQGAGTAAAMCAIRGLKTRELKYEDLRRQLCDDGVFLDY